MRCLGDFLSVNLMRRVVQRISATVSQCARAVIASGFITQLSNSNAEQLQQVFIRDFLMSDQRVHGKASALRGVLTNLLKVSKADDQRRLSSVWVDVLKEWVVRSCQHPQVNQAESKGESSSKGSTGPLNHQNDDNRSDDSSSLQMVDRLLGMLSTARSASRLELGEARACHMAAGG